MATATIHGTWLTVRPTRAERVLGLVRDLRVPLSAVGSASLVTSRPAPRGIGLGTAVPGWAAGSWYSPGCRQLVLLRRGLPVVRLGLHGQRYHEVVVSAADATGLLALLGGAASRSTGGAAPSRLVLVSSRPGPGPVVEEDP